MRPDQTDPEFDNAQSSSDGYRADPADGRYDGQDGRYDDRSDGRADMAMRMARAGSPANAGVASSWQDIKSRFVDDPAAAIAEAEELVQRALDDKIRGLKAEVESMTARDGDGARDGSATEDLRTRLIKYQSYCDRLAR
jgi:hypothetical protein